MIVFNINKNSLKLFLSAFLVVMITSLACTERKNKMPVKSPDFPKAQAVYGNNNDSAFLYFNQVVGNSGDNLEIASAYTYMAWIQSEAGDYFGSQESILKSQQYLNEKKETDQYWIAANYEVLGTTSLNLKHYDDALTYYDLALKSDQNIANHSYYLNNKAVTYQKKKKFDEAIAIYQSLLDQKQDSIVEYARRLSNLAISKWWRDSTYRAASELLAALAIRKTKNDSWGLNASFAHLADYYSKSRKDSALFYAKQMYAIADSLDSPDDKIEALYKLIKLEQPARASKYFNQYVALNDSLQQARNAAKNQFAVIRFNVEKTKADNLKLQKDNAEKRSRIIRQRYIIFSVIFVLAASLVIARLWYKKRKQRFSLESSNAIKEQQLKISKKVHDNVANGLYQLMTEIEHKEMEKETLLDKVERLYEKSRDISYEQTSESTGNYDEKINQLLSSFSGPVIKVLMVGNGPSFWKDISLQTKNELQHILQELLINMKKHSRAKNVMVKFERNNDQYMIRYMDDGTGMSQEVKFGNGLENTVNRIHAMGGTIKFDTGKVNGLRVDISFLNNNDDNKSPGSGRS